MSKQKIAQNNNHIFYINKKQNKKHKPQDNTTHKNIHHGCGCHTPTFPNTHYQNRWSVSGLGAMNLVNSSLVISSAQRVWMALILWLRRPVLMTWSIARFSTGPRHWLRSRLIDMFTSSDWMLHVHLKLVLHAPFWMCRNVLRAIACISEEVIKPVEIRAAFHNRERNSTKVSSAVP